MSKLRIVVADDEPLMLKFMEDVLPRLGHDLVATAEDGQRLIDAVGRSEPDLVITDVKMPDVDGLEAARRIYERRPVPIIIVSAYHDAEFIARANENHVLAYLIKPIKEADLTPAIEIAMRRFGEFQSLRKETSDLRQALEDRKIIERAKGLLMKQAHLDEPAAFRRLQKLARDNSQKLVEVARMVVTAAAALQPEEDDE